MAGALAVLGFALFTAHASDNSPLVPWDNLNSSAYVLVVNERHDSLEVFAEAHEVDNARRYMGIVVPDGSKVFKIPYADTKVTIILGDTTHILDVKKPFLWRLIIKEKLQ